jgi:hypothetical protein
MNAPPAKLPGWTRRRFWGVVGVLFAAQVGLILLFAERAHETAALSPAPVRFHLLGEPLTADQLAKTFFAIDPIVFPLPGLHGFSERAWLSLPQQQFEVPSEKEAPAWLAIDTTRLGTNFPLLNRANTPLPFALADQSGPALDPWPVSLAPELVRTQSVFEIQGELTSRQLNTPAALPAWPSAFLLRNSVVQIAVDSAGQVVAARLLAHSGSPEADGNALDQARSLRFRPVPASAPVWGKAVFEWQTVEPTNASPASPP